jgi:hypothetical protein
MDSRADASRKSRRQYDDDQAQERRSSTVCCERVLDIMTSMNSRFDITLDTKIGVEQRRVKVFQGTDRLIGSIARSVGVGGVGHG